MDITKKINDLIELMNNHANIAEIEVHEDGCSIKVRQHNPATEQVVVQAPAPTTRSTAASVPAAPTSAAKPEINGHAVRCPMVGTVYLSPSPDAKPFIEVGQTVKTGDVLCIVEAMKMMNQIEADKSGTIKARLIENATPVEFDQPLFIIE